MCDLCVQRASACKGLKRFDEAADAYNALLDALQNSNSKIKQNEEFLAEIKECYAACGREAEFEKWEAFFANLPEYVEFREATEKDLDRIEEIYGLIHDEEEAGRTNIGWQREIYPTRKTAAEALEKGTLFVAEAEGQIVAAAKIDQEQVDAYADAAWEHPVAPDEVMVLHTLVVDPTLKGKGYGSKFVLFYEEYALASGCPYLRMDTNERNAAARALYRKLDYTEVGIVSCKFNGIDVVRLVCLEKKL
ncbi:MAG: GNAT family N-acetyltransferase [Clostridia bacterium]|nr:GNAT family N-acetyltransferase [Clostridia bacterium]